VSLPPDARPRFVTPEAVVLEFETAGLGSRTFAILIDLAIQGSVILVAALASAMLAGVGGFSTLATVVLVLVIALVLLGYPIAWETLWRGRTPGKAALGLRVVTKEGAPVQFRHAAVRGFLALVDLYASTGSVAVLSVLFSRDNQRLGDFAAGTVVLRERSGARAPAPVAFTPPAGLESFAATLDTAGLSTADYGAVRSFLVRAHTLPPDVRWALAHQVAETVVARLGHRPPPSLPAELYLVCVAAAHQRRTADLGAVPGVAGHAPGVADPGAPPAAAEWASSAAVWGSAGSRPSPPARVEGGTAGTRPAAPAPAGGYTPPG
jgi:uncharacterized RDD family membrane protein YckC